MKRFVLPLVLITTLGCFAIHGTSRPAQTAENVPWSPRISCALNPADHEGLHPSALSALRMAEVAHRITQGINHSSTRGNVHNTDGRINGRPYTGAADISVRCLTSEQIRMLLQRLADAGFTAWYRNPGQDDWPGPPHIHAVWAGCSLKPVLQRQVRSWLDGRNGLSSNRYYRFWQPSPRSREKVRKLFRASNP